MTENTRKDCAQFYLELMIADTVMVWSAPREFQRIPYFIASSKHFQPGVGLSSNQATTRLCTPAPTYIGTTGEVGLQTTIPFQQSPPLSASCDTAQYGGSKMASVKRHDQRIVPCATQRLFHERIWDIGVWHGTAFLKHLLLLPFFVSAR